MCDDVVLEGRLLQIADVVDDDVCAGLAQRLDVHRHPCLTAVARREIQLGAGRQVVDDLEQRRPFVARPLLARQHRYPRWQVVRGLPLGKRPDAIRDHPDPYTSSIDALGCARRVRPMGHVTLGRVGAGHRLVGGADGLDRGERGEPRHATQREMRPDGTVLRHAVDHRAAQRPDARQDRGCHIGLDVHCHPFGFGIGVRGLLAGRDDRSRWLLRDPPPLQALRDPPPVHALRDPIRLRALRTLRRVQELRANFPLGGRPLRLRGQQLLDLPHGRHRQLATTLCQRLLRPDGPGQQRDSQHRPQQSPERDDASPCHDSSRA